MLPAFAVPIMPQLTVRNVDGAIAAALKQRPQAAGRSAEAEYRRILQEAFGGPHRPDFFELAKTRRVSLRGDASGATDLLRRDRNEA